MLEVLAVAAFAAELAVGPVLSMDWVTVPLEAHELGHFTRHGAKGPDESLIVPSLACQCRPSELFDQLQAAFGNVRTAHVRRDSELACDRTVDHMVVTGLADGVSRMNFDVYAYRTAGALVLIEYTYSKAHAAAADERAMKAVCPSAISSA